MICKNCNEETEEGKFCTSCGFELATDRIAASTDQVVDQTIDPEPTTVSVPVQSEQPKEENEYVEKLKLASSDFGGFFLTLVKKPSTAKEMNSKNLTSGIITMIAFSLIIALSMFITLKSIGGGYYSPTFLDDFFIPFLKFAVLLGLVAVLTFTAAKVTMQNLTITDAIAKYGSYLVPFLLLYVVGIIFSLVGLTMLFSLVTIVSLIGSVLIVPTLILTEQPVKGFDLVYVIIVLSLVLFAIFSYLSSSILSNLIGGMFGGLF